uniref:Uncharacterized protein LOC100375278 n=1 Tax=Saccoglossus kowalevskii TaxID=10224 RepID=A0ABM0MG51_SACKO|nr:PREDICTED: uncharacterized protein LOC100375278 [Saccoglossus kowalevskii]
MFDFKSFIVVCMCLVLWRGAATEEFEDEYVVIGGNNMLVNKRSVSESEQKEIVNLEDKQLDFAENPSSAVEISSVISEDLYSIAVCLWFRIDQPQFGPIWTYKRPEDEFIQFGLISLTSGPPKPLNFNSLLSYDQPSSMDAYDQQWHHMCVNWDYTAGLLQIYIDGNKLEDKTFGGQNGPISPGGTIRLGGTDLTFQLSGFNIYKEFVNERTVATLMTCYGIGDGDVFSWVTDVAVFPDLVKPVELFLENEIGAVCSECMKYEIFPTAVDYDTAREMCGNRGVQFNKTSTLAVLDTISAYRTVRRAILADEELGRGVKTGYWIGLAVHNNSFVWEDGTLLDADLCRKQWASGQPNNKTKLKNGVVYSQDCVQLW